MTKHVVVVGGGLAGLTAAIALRECGIDVTLLEARPRLGGATCSFTRDGLVVDNGQHIFLRCCSAYQGLLDRLGMTGSVRLQDRFDVRVLRPGPPGAPPHQARLRRTGLPGPLHFGLALAGYSFLSFPERFRVGRAALAIKRLHPDNPDVDARRLGDFLAAHGQDEQARRALWDLFTVSALNVAGDDANLALAATVVQTALLGAKDSADIGVPLIPLGDLHGQAGMDLLGKLGAEVTLNAKVAAIEPATGTLPGLGRAFTVRLGRQADLALEADGVILAVPAETAARLLPPGAVPAGQADAWRDLGTSPILNVHAIYDRQVMAGPFTAAVDSPVQWVFDRSDQSGLRRDPAQAGHQYLAVSVSAADELVDLPAAKLREIFLPALAELFPAARQAQVTDFFVTRERRATFRQVPGCERLRPAAPTTLPGLALAGAWTDTGWPDTMEGAVRSGLNAARELRRALGASSTTTTAALLRTGANA
ncbi:MAG TPA: hydroxysqualene dehydroxylase HpnE [Streptosporangiaceae bacterium]|jgi:squalene-associated FAD-dependent desaturase